MATKTIQYGANKPLRISLPDCYWDVLFAMVELEGRTVEELATERLKQIIVEGTILDTQHTGELVANGWRETLKADAYFKDVCG
jgi:hypothetical protein